MQKIQLIFISPKFRNFYLKELVLSETFPVTEPLINAAKLSALEKSNRHAIDKLDINELVLESQRAL